MISPKTIATDIWVCPVPCVPLHLTVFWPIVIPFGPPADAHPEDAS